MVELDEREWVRKRMEIDPERQPMIETMFRLALAGKRPAAIIYEPGTTIGTATLAPNGLTGSSTATLQTSSLPVGDENIVATYSGDANYEPSATEGTHQLAHQAPTKTTLASSANPAQAGKSVTFTASVTPGTAGGATPTGPVSFTDNGSPIQSRSPAALSGGARPARSATPSPAGTTSSPPTEVTATTWAAPPPR
jgi:hypothetical protein